MAILVLLPSKEQTSLVSALGEVYSRCRVLFLLSAIGMWSLHPPGRKLEVTSRCIWFAVKKDPKIRNIGDSAAKTVQPNYIKASRQAPSHSQNIWYIIGNISWNWLKWNLCGGRVPSSSIINDLNAVEKILPRLKDLVPAPPLPLPSRGLIRPPGRQGEPLPTAGSCGASLVGKEENQRDGAGSCRGVRRYTVSELISDRWREPESIGHAGCARADDSRGSRMLLASESGEAPVTPVRWPWWPGEGTLVAQLRWHRPQGRVSQWGGVDGLGTRLPWPREMAPCCSGKVADLRGRWPQCGFLAIPWWYDLDRSGGCPWRPGKVTPALWGCDSGGTRDVAFGNLQTLASQEVEKLSSTGCPLRALCEFPPVTSVLMCLSYLFSF